MRNSKPIDGCNNNHDDLKYNKYRTKSYEFNYYIPLDSVINKRIHHS